MTNSLWPAIRRMLVALVLVAAGVAPIVVATAPTAEAVAASTAATAVIHPTRIDVMISKVTLLNGVTASFVFDRVFFGIEARDGALEFATPPKSTFDEDRSFTKLVEPAVDHLLTGDIISSAFMFRSVLSTRSITKSLPPPSDRDASILGPVFERLIAVAARGRELSRRH